MDKEVIPVCNILGVNIAAINMKWLLDFVTIRIKDGSSRLKGKYICVANVHTTVMSYENETYKNIQNNALMAIPDGGPLSGIGRKRGYTDMNRVTGPDFMGEILNMSVKHGYRHYFYGSTQKTLDKLKANLKQDYHGIEIAGMQSPPFRPLSPAEDDEAIKEINSTNPDFIWIGLGAPKQEIWMANHQGELHGLMVGVGAAFDYYAGNIKRAPKWMQRHNLEWFYRLIQEPGKLFGRYVRTNTKFLWLVAMRGK